jgi:drug/metabolite transporter (DMT)-like permease
MKLVRAIAGATLVIVGIVFTLIPGSILFVLGGLVLLSMDFLFARRFLNKVQRTMSRIANKLDLFLLNRKYK